MTTDTIQTIQTINPVEPIQAAENTDRTWRYTDEDDAGQSIEADQADGEAGDGAVVIIIEIEREDGDEYDADENDDGDEETGQADGEASFVTDVRLASGEALALEELIIDLNVQASAADRAKVHDMYDQTRKVETLRGILARLDDTAAALRRLREQVKVTYDTARMDWYEMYVSLLPLDQVIAQIERRKEEGSHAS